MPRGDGPFQIIEKISDNAHKVDLPCQYEVNATFNVSDLFLFDVYDDSRSNFFKKRGDDVILAMKSKDPLGVSIGSILRPKMQWIQYVNTQKVYIYIYGIDDSTIAADF